MLTMAAATTSSSPSIAFSSLSNTLKSPINPQALKVQDFKTRTHFPHQIRSNGVQAAVGAGKVLSLASIRSFPTLGLETSVFKKEKITLAGQTEMEKVTLAGQDEFDPAVKEALDGAYNDIYAPEKNIENMRGVRCKIISRGIASVGLYLPVGTVVLPSTALMLSMGQEINGSGINANFAVHQDVDGRAFGWSNALGSFATTLEHEQECKSDIFGEQEQGILLGAAYDIMESLTIRYTENGMKEEPAYKYNAECVRGIISRTISTNGMLSVFKSLSKEDKKQFIAAYRPSYNPCTDMLYECYDDVAFGNEICSHVLLTRRCFHGQEINGAGTFAVHQDVDGRAFGWSNASGSFATTLEQACKSVIIGEQEQGILRIAESLSRRYTAECVGGILSRIISTNAMLSVYNSLSEEGKTKSIAAYRPSYNPCTYMLYECYEIRSVVMARSRFHKKEGLPAFPMGKIEQTQMCTVDEPVCWVRRGGNLSPLYPFTAGFFAALMVTQVVLGLDFDTIWMLLKKKVEKFFGSKMRDAFSYVFWHVMVGLFISLRKLTLWASSIAQATATKT